MDSKQHIIEQDLIDTAEETIRKKLDHELQQAHEQWHIDPRTPIASHQKITGRVYTVVKKIIRKLIAFQIEPMVHRQNQFNASVMRTLESLHEYAQTINIRKQHQLARFIDLSEQNADQIRDAFLEMEEVSMATHQFRLTIAEMEKNYQSAPAEATFQNGDTPAMDYLDFENQFRGSEETVKARMTEYLPFYQHNNILDIGCGRGEMLELFRENGITATGIDPNKDMVAHCRKKNLKVYATDAVTYLENCEDSSLGGIFLGQVVEHLELPYLIRLLQLSHAKLQKHGVLILETPNPTSLYIFAHSFYVDPTHVKPLNPYTLDYLLQKAGYMRTQIRFLSPVTEAAGLAVTEGQEQEENLKKLQELLFGCQDYAIIAEK